MAPMMDVESMLTEAITSIGGIPVRSIVGTNPTFANADFLFAADKVIAELKCLDVDQIWQEKTVEKASTAYLDEVLASRGALVVGDQVRTTDKTASPTFIRKIRQLYEDPLKAAVKKANKQIKETRKALDLCDHKGLLIIANNNNTALDPRHARELIFRLFSKESFSGINSVLYLTAGQPVLVEGWKLGHAILDIHRAPKIPAVDLEFIGKLREQWIKALSKALGIPGFVKQINTEAMRTLTNKPRE
jgi:hypothetical protein